MYSIFFSKIDLGFKLVEERLKEIINISAKIVVIPWSFAVETDASGVDKYFSGSKRQKYVEPLLKIGIAEENIVVLNCYRDKKEDMINEIINSDILVLPGGNPEMFYNKVEQLGLLETIRNYKKIVIGESAGTELQLNNYFITAKNNYYKKFAWYNGFGIVKDPFYMDVHSSNNYNYLKKLQKVANETNKKVYAIYNEGAIIFNRETNKLELFGKVVEFTPGVS